MNLVEALLSGRAESEAPAILTLEGQHSYAELARAADAVGSHLLEMGVKKGDFVALVAENSFFSISTYLGILRSGGVAVPLSAGVSEENWRFVVETTRLRFVFLDGKASPNLTTALPRGAHVVCDVDMTGAWSRGGALRNEWPEVDEANDLAAVLFTSGSTRQPRGVMLTHRNLLANSASIIEYLGLSAADRAMLVLPFYYSFGASVVVTHLRVGGSLVVDHRFMFPDKVLAHMQATRCTGFAGVPSHYQSLLRRSRLKSMEFPALRWVQQAGGKLSRVFVDELRAALPSVRVYLMYGATENTARIAYLPPERLADKPDSVGVPIPGVRVRLLDERGAPVGPMEVGEVVVEGDSVSPGYLHAPQDTAATFRGGRLHTGDLARADEEGFLFIVDRLGDFLKCGGTRTSSKAVEGVLLEFPDVVEAAVLGVPDDVLGEAVALFVVPRPGGESQLGERLLAFAKERLAVPLVPRVIKVLTSLPKNSSGKLLKPELRTLLSRDRG